MIAIPPPRTGGQLLPLLLLLFSLSLPHCSRALAAEPSPSPSPPPPPPPPPAPSLISHFTVVNPDTDEELFRLEPGAVLSLPHPIAFRAHLRPSPANASSSPSSSPSAGTPAVPFVKFLRPYAHVERYAPYALPGDSPRGDFHPVFLAPGRHAVAARAATDPPGVALSVSFELRPPRFPPRGPHPRRADGLVVVDVDSPDHPHAQSSGTAKTTPVPVPTISPPCDRPHPRVEQVSVQQDEDHESAEVAFRIAWCPPPSLSIAQDSLLRVRVLAYSQHAAPDPDEQEIAEDRAERERGPESGRLVRRSVVIAARLANYLASRQTVNVRAPCRATPIYVEVCGLRVVANSSVANSSANNNGNSSAAATVLVCGTSEFRTLAARPAFPPDGLVAQFPPRALALAPGDSARMRYVLSATSRGSVATVRLPALLLSVSATAADGYHLGAGPWVSTAALSAAQVRDGENSTRAVVVEGMFPFRRQPSSSSSSSPGGVSVAAHDGATVFLRYARADCPAVVRSLRARLNTSVRVSAETPALLRQDAAAPVLQSPLRFPATPAGGSVTLRARADNSAGGGYRAASGAAGAEGGNNTATTATRLTYQWFVRRTGFFGSRRTTFAQRVEGATAQILRLDNVTCEVPRCGRDGCTALARYSVQVCNTLACVVSNDVRPNVTAPRELGQGERWNAARCRVEVV